VPSKTTDLISLTNGYTLYVSIMALHAFPYIGRFEFLQNFISMNISCKWKGRWKKASKYWNL